MNLNHDYTVEFIVPNEYRGVIILEKDKERGAEPVVRDGATYVYTVPDSGTLLVKSFALFEKPHFTMARYASGREIPTLYSGRSRQYVIDSDEVALHEVGSQVKGQENPKIIVFVGTLDGFRACQKQFGFAR